LIIKKKKKHDPIREAAEKAKVLQLFLGWKILALMTISLLIVISIVLGSVALYTNEGSRVLGRVLDLRMYPAVFFQYAKAQLHVAEQVSLDVKHINMQKLAYSRETRLNPKVEAVNEYVAAKFRYNGKTYAAKIRLKGDRSIHFDDMDKLSFRVKMKGNDVLWGMKTFSLQKPRARNYVHEWIFHRMMEEQGLIALRYKFINLTLNGKDLGTYAVEEHFGKELIENHERREGPIIRFEEISSEGFRSARVLPYDDKTWRDEGMLPLIERSTFLLSGFQNGTLTLDQVFDAKKLGRFYAVNDLIGTYHAGVSKSMRFYYNPITGKLEPIPFDGHFGTIYNPVLSSELGLSLENGRWIFTTDKDWLQSIFQSSDGVSENFYKSYIATLDEITNPNFLDAFFARNKKEIASNLALIYRDMPLADNIAYFGPEPHYFKKRALYRRQSILAQRMKQTELDVHQVFDGENEIVLDVSILVGALPIRVTGISCGSWYLKPDQPIVVLPHEKGNGTRPAQVIFQKPSSTDAATEEQGCNLLHYQILTREEELSEKILPWPSFANYDLTSDFLLAMDHIDRGAPAEPIEIDADGNWVIAPGQHNFSTDLIVPENTRLIVQAGAQLNFNGGAMLLSKSPIDFRGQPDRPIVVSSPDKTANGILILKAPSQSTWQYVHFKGLSNPKKIGWTIPGAVTIFESSIVMDNVTFSNNACEDSLNIARSTFTLSNLKFNTSQSDALDFDFSKGTLTSSQFYSSGNDAIDMSGSRIQIQDVLIDGVGDKAISVGERSTAKLSKIVVRNAEIGLTSKDQSYLELEQAELENIQLGFIAFQKKPEYGPGRIVARNVTMNNVGIPYLVEDRSDVNVNNERIPPSGENLRKLLYGVKFGQASGAK
jgi:CotH kinase protein